MLANVRMGKEVVVTITNKVGALAEMTNLLADAGININAVAGHAASGNQAKIMFVTADNARAMEVLKNKQYPSVVESDVVIAELENRAGALKQVSLKLATDNIDIKYIYGTTCGCQGPAMIILATSDNQKALNVIKGA